MISLCKHNKYKSIFNECNETQLCKHNKNKIYM